MILDQLPLSTGRHDLNFVPSCQFSTEQENESVQMWLVETIPQLSMKEVVTNNFECMCAYVSVCKTVQQTSTGVRAAEQRTWKRLSGKV